MTVGTTPHVTYSRLMWEGTVPCRWCYSYSGGPGFHEKVAGRSYKELSSKQCSSKALLPLMPLLWLPSAGARDLRVLSWNKFYPSQLFSVMVHYYNNRKPPTTVEILLNPILVILWSSMVCWLQFYKAIRCLLSLLSPHFHLPFCSSSYIAKSF